MLSPASVAGNAGRHVERDGRAVQAEHDVGAPRPRRRRRGARDPGRPTRTGSQPRTAHPAATSSAAILPPASPRPSTATLHRSSPRRARGARSGRRRARPPRTAAAAARSRSRPLERDAAATSPTLLARQRHRRRRSPSRQSPGPIPTPPTTTGASSSPTSLLGRPLRPHEPRPDRQPDRAARRGRARRRRPGSPRRPGTCACVASRSPTSATGAGSALVSTSTSPGSRARRPRAPSGCRRRAQSAVRARPATPRAGHDLDQREVDEPGPPGGLVDRGNAEPCELREPRHSASTTSGISRWNASA